MRALISILFVAQGLLAIAQKSPIKFGEIPMEDMVMTIYDKDSSAAAVILNDYGKAYVSVTSVSASLYFERHTRIKVLKNGGLSWADVGIPVYHSGSNEEKITNLKASAFNLEGGKIVETKMSKDGVFKEKFNKQINLQKFTIPNVKEGTIIEYSYTVMSDFLTNFPNWQFQYSVPVRNTEYWAIIPDFFVMEKYMQGYITPTQYDIKPKTQSGYFEKAHHWIIDHVPAFEEEPFMTSEDDYLSRVNFALSYINFPGQPSQEIMGSWGKLTKELQEAESFGKIITGSGFLKKQVETLVMGKTDAMEKLAIIHNYVKTTLEWDGTKDFTSDNLKDVFEKKKGTSGDINLALASMLEKADFEVDMVLLSTRDHGFVRQSYPMSKQLNYVVCRVWVEGKPIFLDATEKYIPIDVLPERCLNGEGLLVSEKNTGWVALATKAKTKKTATTDLKLNEDGTLSGTLTLVRDGYSALAARKRLNSITKEEYIKDFSQQNVWSITSSTFDELDNVVKPLRETHQVTLEQHATTTGDVVYLNPFILFRIEENPFKLEKRDYPVDFGSAQETVYMCKINLPDGYLVDELPQSKVLMLNNRSAKLSYSVSQMGNAINIIYNFQIAKPLFSADEYLDLKELYNQVVAKQNEQIVLKKK
jgi:hypothetical protein